MVVSFDGCEAAAKASWFGTVECTEIDSVSSYGTGDSVVCHLLNVEYACLSDAAVETECMSCDESDP